MELGAEGWENFGASWEVQWAASQKQLPPSDVAAVEPAVAFAGPSHSMPWFHPLLLKKNTIQTIPFVPCKRTPRGKKSKKKKKSKRAKASKNMKSISTQQSQNRGSARKEEEAS